MIARPGDYGIAGTRAQTRYYSSRAMTIWPMLSKPPRTRPSSWALRTPTHRPGVISVAEHLALRVESIITLPADLVRACFTKQEKAEPLPPVTASVSVIPAPPPARSVAAAAVAAENGGETGLSPPRRPDKPSMCPRTGRRGRKARNCSIPPAQAASGPCARRRGPSNRTACPTTTWRPASFKKSHAIFVLGDAAVG